VGPAGLEDGELAEAERLGHGEGADPLALERDADALHHVVGAVVVDPARVDVAPDVEDAPVGEGIGGPLASLLTVVERPAGAEVDAPGGAFLLAEAEADAVLGAAVALGVGVALEPGDGTVGRSGFGSALP